MLLVFFKPMYSFTHTFFQTLTHIFLPSYCLLCKLTPATDGLCSACIQSLPWQQASCPCCAQPMLENRLCGQCLQREHYYDQIIAPLRYERAMRYFVNQFKFHERLIVAHLFSTLLIQHLKMRHDFLLPDLLLPVPLHSTRMRMRGFNQALELAKPLAATFKIPLHRTLLYKKHASVAQSLLDFKTRKKNIKKLFGLKYSVLGKHVGIVDDVVTTGSTVNEIAKLLKQNGATRVSVFAIARTAMKN